MRLRAASTSSLSLLLAATGCMVGPHYTRPSVVTPPAYKEATDPAWAAAQPADSTLRGDWWTIFGDAELNALEPQVTVTNQTLKAAEAQLRQARAQITVNHAALAPTIGASPYVGGLRDSNSRPYSTATQPNNAKADLQLPLDMSYELDLWGRVRRTISAAREEAQATAADLQTAQLSLQSELAIDYFEARTADAEEKLLNDTVKDYEEAFRITTNRFEGGVSGESDVDQANTQLETARVQARDVAIRREQYEHAIAVLLGKPPAEFTLPPSPLAAQPPVIPTGLPAELLQRRPDIAAAERRMAEASDRIGIARAAYFPTISLAGIGGFESTSIASILGASNYTWALGTAASQTLFDFGRRRGITDQAIANYDQLVANYRQTTLTAFQQVEDNVSELRVLQQEAQHQHQATQAAQAAEQIFNNRYVGGIDNYLQVVTAQTTALANERNEIDIMRRRMDASVLLIKALGGGWNVSALPKY
ncbi:MAG: efflux transporter outer membrane subunit [Acidobacteriota bacterium]|nr:efflux transporter outer membrane subunit [Acidobacteriota bacterium]